MPSPFASPSKSGDPRRIAIVTGGSNGIGATIVRQLAARGMRVVNLDRAPQPDGLPADFHQVDLL
jgi:NAD(P)-dependent dehydrogenase (short-subunit alcohol dehydrogenase family)